MREPTWWSDLVDQLRWWLAHMAVGLDQREWSLIPVHVDDLPGMWLAEGTPAYDAACAVQDAELVEEPTDGE